MTFRYDHYGIIVGIGTCYAFTGNVSPKESKKTKFPSIYHVADWPKQKNQQHKTPSIVIYDQNYHLMHWGSMAAHIVESGQVEDGHRVIERFKHDLPTSIAQTGSIRPTGNTSLEQFFNLRATIDYFREIFDYTVIAMQYPDMTPLYWSKIERENIRFVISVPIQWNDIQKRLMRIVAMKAGLISEDDHEKRLIIINESLAASLYCERKQDDIKRGFDDSKNELASKNVKYMICDAGGATVSITVFEITENGDKKDNDSFHACQLTADIGKKCGSVYLDLKMKEVLLDICFGADKEAWKDNKPKKEALESLIAPVVEQFIVSKANFGKVSEDFIPDCCRKIEEMYDSNDSDDSEFLNDDSNVAPKCEFCDFFEGNDEQYVEHDNFGDETFFFIRQGKILEQLRLREDCDGVITKADDYQCTIILSYKFMRENVFDQVIENTLKLLQRQIKKSNGNITRTYMTGGFGGSPYLYKRILNEFPIDSPFYIGELIQDKRGDIATMQGALNFGINAGRTESQSNLAYFNYENDSTSQYNTLVCLDIGYNGTASCYRDLRGGYEDMIEIMNWPGLNWDEFITPTAKKTINGKTLCGGQVEQTTNRNPESFITPSKLMSTVKGSFKIYLIEYLKLLFEHIHGVITKSNPTLFDKNKYRFVITMENCYQFFKNKSEMRQIAQMAGIIDENDSPRRLLLIRRENAAAMHFEKTEFAIEKGNMNHFLQINLYHDTCHLSLHESTRISDHDEDRNYETDKYGSICDEYPFRNVRSMRSVTFAFNFVERLVTNLDSFVSKSDCISCNNPNSHDTYTPTYYSELKEGFLKYMENNLDFSKSEETHIITITEEKCCIISVAIYDLLEHVFRPATRNLASEINRFAIQANITRSFNLDKIFLSGILIKARKEAYNYLEKLVLKDISEVMNIPYRVILPSYYNGKEALMGAAHYGYYPGDFTERVSRRSYVVQVRGYKRQEFSKDVKDTILQIEKKKGRGMKDDIYNEEAANAFIDQSKEVELYYQSSYNPSLKNADSQRASDDVTLLIGRGDKISEHNQMHGISKRFYAEEECIVYVTIYSSENPTQPKNKSKVDTTNFNKIHQFELYIKRDEDDPTTVYPGSRLHFDVRLKPDKEQFIFEAFVCSKLGKKIPEFCFDDPFLVANFYDDEERIKIDNKTYAQQD